MKKRIVSLFCISSLYLIIGCTIGANKIDDQMYKNYLTKPYRFSKIKCYNATIEALKELKIAIEKTDKEKGIIVTERSNFGLSAEGGPRYAELITFEHKYYFKITGDEKNSIITVSKFRYWRKNIEQTELSYSWFSENVWGPVFKEIQMKLDEM